MSLSYKYAQFCRSYKLPLDEIYEAIKPNSFKTGLIQKYELFRRAKKLIAFGKDGRIGH